MPRRQSPAIDATSTTCSSPRFWERPADRIDEREWQDLFDELARAGLSHLCLANAKAVASSIYAWALHRIRRHATSNPLRYIELPPNLGKRRERVALAEEAERSRHRRYWRPSCGSLVNRTRDSSRPASW